MKILMHDYPFPNKGKKGKGPHPLLRDTGDFAVTGSGGTIGLYAESARLFEGQLINDGYLIIKCFFHVSKQAQKERIDKLRESESTSWRVTESDIRQNKHYDEYYTIIDALLERQTACGTSSPPITSAFAESPSCRRLPTRCARRSSASVCARKTP